MKKTLKSLSIIGLASTLSVAGIVACSKSSDTAAAVAAASALATAFPSGFAVSSPTAQQGAALTLSSGNRVRTFSGDESLEEKQEAITEMINGTTEVACTAALNLSNITNANCYGPQLYYSNHPDQAGAPDGNLPTGDLGLWSETNAGGEACAAAQLNARMGGMSQYADTGMFVMASMFCAANVAGQALPAVGGSLDLAANMEGLVTINTTAVTVTTASLERAADDADGNPVYISTLVGTAGTTTYSVRLKHVATATDNSTYQGKLSVKIAYNTGSPAPDGNCSGATGTGYQDAMSLDYEKASSTDLKYKMMTAGFCAHDADPYVSATDYTVDLVNKIYNTYNKGWGNNANITIANMNPTTGEGSFKYAWQAGKGDGNTRVFNAVIADSSGTLAGTAYFGYGVAASAATGVGDISGIICNWAGPGAGPMGSKTIASKAQKQVMSINASGVFVPTSSYIEYYPTNNCNGVGAGLDSPFYMGTSPSPTTDVTSEVNNLVASSEISGTIGTVTNPVNVDE